MKSHHPALLALTAAAVLTGGCTKLPLPGSPAEPATAPTASASAPAASPAPAGPDAREQLLAALTKTKNATYSFTVGGDVVDGKKITGSGSFDPKGKRITTTKKLTGAGKTEQGQVIVVGTDFYSREKSGETWVHLNLKRVKKDGLYYYDMTDPTGLSRFVSSVDTVRRTGPNTFSGTLDIEGDKFNDGFLPVGTPAISVWFGGDAQFSAITDAAGWVTSIGVALRDKDKTLRMTTRLSGHGKTSTVKKPARFGEAMDIYYS